MKVQLCLEVSNEGGEIERDDPELWTERWWFFLFVRIYGLNLKAKKKK